MRGETKPKSVRKYSSVIHGFGFIFRMTITIYVFTYAGEAYASCNSTQSMTFEAFDGRMASSNPTEYLDSKGRHTIIPNIFCCIYIFLN